MEKKFTKSHEWIIETNGVAKIGLTDHAQKELGDIVYINLPAVGDKVVVGKSFCDVESVKAVSDVYAPVTGVVTAVNEALVDSPELVNENCYDAWLIEVSEISDRDEYLDEAGYLATL